MLNYFKILSFSFFYSTNAKRSLNCKNCGPPPLPSVRYAGHVLQAIKLANTLLGLTSSQPPELLWMQPVTCHFPPTDDAEDNIETIEEIEFISELDPGPDEVLLGDVLKGSNNNEEDDPPDILCTCHATCVAGP